MSTAEAAAVDTIDAHPYIQSDTGGATANGDYWRIEMGEGLQSSEYWSLVYGDEVFTLTNYWSSTKIDDTVKGFTVGLVHQGFVEDYWAWPTDGHHKAFDGTLTVAPAIEWSSERISAARLAMAWMATHCGE